MAETWLPVVGYEEYYEVSDAGRVRSLPRVVAAKNGSTQARPGRILKTETKARYQRVTLRGAGCPFKIAMVHHIVAEAFHGPRPSKYFVCHKDGNAHNNRAGNLYYGTASDNMRDKIEHGNNFQVEKEVCPRGHLLLGMNLDSSQLLRGGRTCSACHKAWMAVKIPGRDISYEVLADRIYGVLMANAWPSRKGQQKSLMAALAST